MNYDGVRGFGVAFERSLCVTLAGPYVTDCICLALGALIVISEPLMLTWILASTHTLAETWQLVMWSAVWTQSDDPMNVSLKGSGVCRFVCQSVCVCVACVY